MVKCVYFKNEYLKYLKQIREVGEMNFLEERIVKDGVVKEGNVLKVDSFLNHQMDIELLEEMGGEFKRRFAGKHIIKVLTIEASGIGIALIYGAAFFMFLCFSQKKSQRSIWTEKCMWQR